MQEGKSSPYSFILALQSYLRFWKKSTLGGNSSLYELIGMNYKIRVYWKGGETEDSKS